MLQRRIEALERWMKGEDIIMDGTMTRGEFGNLLDDVRKRCVFIQAKKEIYKLMVRDSYPRFQKHDKYKAFVNNLGLYSTANADFLSSKMAKLKDRNNDSDNRGGRGRSSLSGTLTPSKRGVGGGGSMFNLGLGKLSDRASSVRTILDSSRSKNK